jgi:dipeptidyl aminopeptidase/acylaminoacyl peptidase
MNPTILRTRAGRLLLALALSAPAALAVSAQAAAPPLLDRELFFGNPEIAAATLSPDGRYIAYLKPWKETRNVWVKKTGEGYDKGRLVTADPKRPIPGFFWTKDSKYVLFVQDKDGDENYNVYAVDPAAAPEAGKDAPPARNLTDAKGARALIYAVPKADPDTIYVGLNDREAAWHDVYKVKISTGERTLVKKNTERIAGWDFDNAGALRLAERTTNKGDTEILRVDADGFKLVYSCTVFESCGLHRFHRDDKRVYLETNKGEPDLSQLLLLDPATGKTEFVESDPMKHVDFGEPIFSDATDELVATSYEDERTRLYFRDKGYESDFALLEKKLGNKTIRRTSSTREDNLWTVSAASDTDPGTVYLFDRKTKTITSQYVVRERIPREQMATVKAIRYKSSDGLEIPAYLTLPKGVAAKNLPLIVLPHGGPWARDTWGFGNLAQFLANRSYAILQPNFRASTGYGKKFLNAGNRQWGDLMQDDLTWGVKHLVAEGVADPKHVGILGGSYGGYATLAGVAFTPDLYEAAVAYVAPSNLLTLLETIPPYWESGRVIFHERMGNPNTPEGKKQLERQSPLNSASKIRTPLMVVQGANDPRVKKAESEQIVIALRDRGFPVEYILAPDEGHGFARPINNLALWASTEAFLAKHLGGRFQEGGTPETVARLKEITVDPKTVVLAKKVDAAAVGAPKPVGGLVAGTYKYAGSIQTGGQTIPISGVNVVTEETGTYTVNYTMKLPMGEASDVVTMDKASLQPVKRVLRQGPVSMDLAFKDGKVSGTVAMGGEPKPVDAVTGGELFADGSSAWESLARLPLAEGYAVTYRNFDVQKQKPTLKQLKVLGAEEITVAAGTFKTWKAEVSSAEGEAGSTTVWVDKASRKVVKTSSVVPQMGGATVTSELQP